jgi:hypothetical protein
MKMKAGAVAVDRLVSTPPNPRFLRIKEAAVMFSVSEDWIRRNKSIPKVSLGRRLVRVDVVALEQFFRQHEV